MNSRSKNIILYPFRILGKILILVLFIGIIYSIYEFAIYFKNANKFEQDDVSQTFKDNMSAFGDNLYCINTLDTSGNFVINKEYNVLLFLARARNRSTGYTGHAWLIWMKAAKLDNGKIKINEFIPAGFGPNVDDLQWTEDQIEFYKNNIQPNIAVENRETVEKVLRALNYGPKKYNESKTKITEKKPIIIEKKI